jgi:hypothetical protein
MGKSKRKLGIKTPYLERKYLMKDIRKLSPDNYWDYELGYWWFSDVSRFGKVLSHVELYKRIIDLPGTIAEFGVYKANSLIRWLSLREIFETSSTRKIIGFDAFGSFPTKGLSSVSSDLNFVKEFEKDGGDGLSLEETNLILKAKSFTNYELIDGDVRNTLLDFLKKNTVEKFSLIHLDMDVYEPTAFVLEKLYNRLVTGGLIVIDDYNTVEGATTAVDEFIVQHPNLKIEKLPYNNIPSFIKKC